MIKLYFQKRINYAKNEILFSSFFLLFDSGFSKKILREKVILKDLKNLAVTQSYCFLTNKQYSIFKRYRLSRIEFRNQVGLGLASGIRRSVF